MNSPSLLEQLQEVKYPAFTVGHIDSQAQHTRFDPALKKDKLSEYREKLSLSDINSIVEGLGTFAHDLSYYYIKSFEAFYKISPRICNCYRWPIFNN